MALRKAASVLPEPVGAAISTLRPAVIAGQASACAGVGAAKLWSNHARNRGVKNVQCSWGKDCRVKRSDMVSALTGDRNSCSEFNI